MRALTKRPPTRASARQRPSSSLVDEAYERIKHLITTCRIRPGDAVNESEIAASLGIGRTPVHQAFDRLMVEGLVDVIPRKGILVKPVSLDEVMQIIEVRLMLECACVQLAAERATAAELDHLGAILRRAEAVLATRDTEQLMLLDREFHGRIADASRNPILGEVLGRLHDRSLRFWAISLNTPGHHQSTHEQHLAILGAIRDRDPAAAERSMRSHIEAFRRNLMHVI